MKTTINGATTPDIFSSMGCAVTTRGKSSRIGENEVQIRAGAKYVSISLGEGIARRCGYAEGDALGFRVNGDCTRLAIAKATDGLKLVRNGIAMRVQIGARQIVDQLTDGAISATYIDFDGMLIVDVSPLKKPHN